MVDSPKSIPTRSRINRQSVIHPSIHPSARASRRARLVIRDARPPWHHHRRRVVASSRRRVVASSSSRRRRIAPKSAPAPPWRITIRSNKTSQNDARRRVAQWRPRVASPMCSDGAPIDAFARSRVRECATRRGRRVRYDDDTDGDVSRDASQVTGEFSRVRDDRGRCATMMEDG